jgi:hypothetical protein
MLWATPEEVLRGALQAAASHNRGSALLIITAAWTGCRVTAATIGISGAKNDAPGTGAASRRTRSGTRPARSHW